MWKISKLRVIHEITIIMASEISNVGQITCPTLKFVILLACQLKLSTLT